MEPRRNAFEQPIGTPVPDWTGAGAPGREPLAGRYCRIEPVNVERHAADLHDAYRSAADGRDWTYLTIGPFDSLGADEVAAARDWWRLPAEFRAARAVLGFGRG